MIEDVFKDHKRVLPALGLIPKIDFLLIKLHLILR